MSVRYFRNCDEINIYAFDKISREGDYSYMVMGWDGFEEVEIDEQVASGHWSDIYNEYCKLTNDNQSLMYYELIGQINYLETRKAISYIILNQLIIGEKEPKIFLEYIEELSKWGYFIDLKKDFKAQYNKVIKQLKFSQNKINAKKAALKEIQHKSTEPIDLIEQGVGLELALDKNDINLKNTSVKKWIALFKRAKERSERMKKRAA